MKTQNLTTWCNLYSSESKYNFVIRKSRYEVAVYSATILAVIVVSIIYFSFYYQLALLFTAVGVVGISLYLSNNDELKFQYLTRSIGLDVKPPLTHIFLTRDGKITFNKANTPYQLLKMSRVSFIGCWLIMVPSSAAPSSHQKTSNFTFIDKRRNTPKRIFIYKDSFIKKDFSCLVRVIKQLQ